MLPVSTGIRGCRLRGIMSQLDVTWCGGRVAVSVPRRLMLLMLQSATTSISLQFQQHIHLQLRSCCWLIHEHVFWNLFFFTVTTEIIDHWTNVHTFYAKLCRCWDAEGWTDWKYHNQINISVDSDTQAIVFLQDHREDLCNYLALV